MEITGYSRHEAIGKPLVTGFIVKKLRASVQQVMSNALKGIETSNYELEFRTKSNQIRYLLGKQNTGHRSLVYPTHRHVFHYLIRLSHSFSKCYDKKRC